MPTLNAGVLLEEVLAGIARQRRTGLECVAIDSGSKDGTVERLQGAGFRVLHIPQSEFDHGTTRDRAIAASRGEVIVLLTQDATPVGTDWLQAMLAPFEDPQVAGVWCRQEPRPGCQPILAQRIRGWPGWGNGVRVQRLQPGEALSSLPPMERLMRCAFDNVASAVRRSAWERFPLGPRKFGEDVWFGVRAIEAGLSLAHQGGAAVVHSHSRTPFAEGRRTFCDHRNLVKLFGLVTIPDWRTMRSATRAGIEGQVRYVQGLDLEPTAKAEAVRWTRAYVRWQNWGQYLGAKAGADPVGMKGWLLRRLGRLLERGIG